MAVNPITTDDLTIDLVSLLSLSIGDRVQAAASDNGFAEALMQSLTPIQLAKAFPDYYRKELPDISNFILANRYLDSGGRFDQRGGGEYGIDTDQYQGEAGVSGNRRPRNVPEPTLEEIKARLIEKGIDVDNTYAALQQGAILESDEKFDYLKKMSEDELKSVGMQRVQDESGKTIIKLLPTEASGLSNEDVMRRASDKVIPGTQGLKGRAALAKQTYDAFIEAGLSDKQAKSLVAEVNRENSLDPKYMFGTHAEHAAQAKGRTNYGIFSWGDPSRVKEFKKYMQDNGIMDNAGNLIADNDAYLKAQAKFSVQEMQGYEAGRKFLENKDVSAEEGTQLLGRYIGWDMAGRRHDARASYERLREGRNIIDDVTAQMGKILPTNPTPEQIEEARKILDQKEKEGWSAALAKKMFEMPSPRSSGAILENGRYEDLYYENILNPYDIHSEREGSISLLNSETKSRLGAMLRDAPDYVKKEIKIQSAYRDPQLQSRLHAQSGGSPYVAKKSQHSEGMAVDLGSGKGGTASESWNNLSEDTKNWINQNAANYGLYRPLQPEYGTSVVENWHFEPIGNRGEWQKNQPKADMTQWIDPLYKTETAVIDTTSSQRVFIGDSIAQGMRDIVKGEGKTQVGRKPHEVLSDIESLGSEYFKGKEVILSTGLSNGTHDVESVRKQMEFLKQSGANVKIAGMSNSREDLAPGNQQLQDLANEYGYGFMGGFEAGKDKIHPTNYDNYLASAMPVPEPTQKEEKSIPAPVPEPTKEEVKAYQFGGTPEVQDDEDLTAIGSDGKPKFKFNSGEGLYVKPEANEYADDKMNELSDRLDRMTEAQQEPRRREQPATQQPKADPRWAEKVAAAYRSSGTQQRAFNRAQFRSEGRHVGDRGSPNIA